MSFVWLFTAHPALDISCMLFYSTSYTRSAFRIGGADVSYMCERLKKRAVALEVPFASVRPMFRACVRG